jgi:hypothetical protein
MGRIVSSCRKKEEPAAQVRSFCCVSGVDPEVPLPLMIAKMGA